MTSAVSVQVTPKAPKRVPVGLSWWLSLRSSSCGASDCGDEQQWIGRYCIASLETRAMLDNAALPIIADVTLKISQPLATRVSRTCSTQQRGSIRLNEPTQYTQGKDHHEDADFGSGNADGAAPRHTTTRCLRTVPTGPAASRQAVRDEACNACGPRRTFDCFRQLAEIVECVGQCRRVRAIHLYLLMFSHAA